METSTKNTVNSMTYKTLLIAENGEQVEIVIQLADECKNGQNDFSITGTIYEARKKRCDRNTINCGAIGNTIVKKFPQFSIFNKLHLSDVKGQPMYAVENGFYQLGRLSEEDFKEYYRVSQSQYNDLGASSSEEDYKNILKSSGVLDNWQEEATKGIALLEELTGKKFEDNSVRFNIK